MDRVRWVWHMDFPVHNLEKYKVSISQLNCPIIDQIASFLLASLQIAHNLQGSSSHLQLWTINDYHLVVLKNNKEILILKIYPT